MTNGYDPNTVASFVDRIEILKAELKEASGEVGRQINAITQEEQESAGIPPKALRMVLHERTLRTKIEALSLDDNQAFAHLTAALAALAEPAEQSARTAPATRLREAPQTVRAA